MANRLLYVDGDNGNDSWDGTVPVFTSGTTGPKASLSSMEAKPVAAGDLVYVRPKANGGAYRETLTCGVSGGTPYTTGTVSLTNGSAIVAGSGTTWSTNAFADGQFRPDTYVSGGDGVTDGSDTLTSAGASFAAWVVGNAVAIAGKGVFTIIARTATTLQMTKADGTAAAPSAGTGLAYMILPHSPYEIASVDSDTQLTLKEPWAGPTMSGVPYETWRDIKYVGDTDGAIWGVGGVVRISGSDNDQSATRGSCIVATAATRNARTFRGFALDTTTSHVITVGGAAVQCDRWVVEDCSFASGSGDGVNLLGAGIGHTVRRCFGLPGQANGLVLLTQTSTVSDKRHIVEDCVAIGRGPLFYTQRVGGVLFRNNTAIGGSPCYQVVSALAAGQLAVFANNIAAQGQSGISVTAASEGAEDCNTIFGCNTARVTITAGGQSVAYPPLFAMPLLASGTHRMPLFSGQLSANSQIRARAGVAGVRKDLTGSLAPATASKRSWGALQYSPQVRDTGTVHAGSTSRKLPDAGDLPPIYLAVSNVSTTLTLYVYREANYAGPNPQVIIRQPGQPDITLTDAGSAGGWNALTTTWTPAASPGWVAIICRSNNTATSGSYGVYFDT